MFSSPSKGPGHPLAGLDGLARATEGRRVPVLAIGGIVPDLAETVARAGADGIAGIGLFIPPAGRSFDAHVEGVVSRLRRTFDTCGVVP
jgi:thiamine monophosphate synthase